MKQIRFILFGIAVLLFGVCANLLAGLDLPTLRNGIYELLGVICPFVGIAISGYGLFCKDETVNKEKK